MSQRVEAVFEYLDAVSSAIFIVQTEQIVWANHAAAVLTGYDSLVLCGMHFTDLFAPRWREHEVTPQAAIELELLASQGDFIWVELTLKPIEFNGSMAEIITANDIRQRKQTEQRESALRQVIAGTPDAFYKLDSLRGEDGQIIDFIFADMNEHGRSVLQLSKEELIGNQLCELFPVNRTDGFLEKYIRVVETGQFIEEEFSLNMQTGKVWLHHQVIRVGDGVAIFTRNVTERKLTENALRESEQSYRALLNQSNDCVSLLDLNGYYLLVNDQLASRMGYSVEEMIGMHITEIILPSEISHYHGVDKELKEGYVVPLFERIYRRKDGTLFLGEVNISLVHDANGQPLYVQSIMRDITWRKNVENALRESEERYRIISELISDYAYAFRIDPDGTLVHEWITDSFKRMTGYEQEEIDEQGQYALFHPDDEARTEADVQRVLRGEPSSEEYRIVTKAGEVRWVHIFRQPEWDQAHQRVIRMYGVAQDVTERKRSEEELRKSEEKYRLITENASDMISSTGIDGIRTFVSSACRRLLGYEPEELVGRPNVESIHPDDLETMIKVNQQMQTTTEPITFVCRTKRKDGSYIWLEITGKAIRDPESRRVTETITVARDISQRKQMEAILLEQERLRYELQNEQELNEAKSNLMRTISHEFRTPLTLIVTATDFLDTYIERLNTERRKERLQAIRDQVKHMSDMLDDISFVIQGTLHHMIARPSRINLEAFCRTVLEEIQMAVGKDHQFIFSTDGQLQNGIADKALIVRIMGNLLSNAVKYSPENSVITVMLYRSGDEAILQVSDQGIGMDEEEQKHIFEPFYRSNSVIDSVGGTGLGLSIVKDCVDLHHGTINVESAPGKGTTFIVRLPQNIE